MRRLGIVVVGFGLIGGGVVGAAVGCGSDDPGAIPSPDASTSSSSSSTSGSSGDPGPSSSSSSSSSGSAETDAGDGGPASGSNPNRITCGTQVCDAGGGNDNSGICCARPTTPVCLTIGTSNECDNSIGENTLQLSCDETLDCPKVGRGQLQQKCCLFRGGELRAECRTSCRDGEPGPFPPRPQLCKTDVECSDGGADQPTCAEKTCSGVKVRVCGTPDGCTN